MAPPAGTIPPPLPPSVEEAYRRKCIQLKQRMNEVDESNDAARLRIARVGREIEKLRLERAFLLENLAKRTSTNVEDSEGSPSPPPTSANDSNQLQPKEKPLRTKRGHRKPSFMNNLGDGRPGTAFIQQGPVTLSPSSETFSHTHPDHSNPPRNSTPQAQPQQKRVGGSNGYGPNIPPTSSTPPPRRPKNAFDLYCSEMRPSLTVHKRAELATGTYDIERALAEGWQGLSVQEKDAVQQRFEQLKKGFEAEKETAGGRQTGLDAERGTPTPTPNPIPAPARQVEDEDVEMTEEGRSPTGTGDAESGFTAVNRG